MEPLFIVRRAMNREDNQALMRVNRARSTRLMLTGMLVVLAVSVVYGGISGDWGLVLKSDFLYPFTGLVALYALYLWVIMPRKFEKNFEKRLSPDMSEMVFSFGEERLEMADEKGTTTVEYRGGIKGIATTPERVIVVFDAGASVLAGKHFVKGDPAALASFLEQRAGLKAEHYHVRG